MSGRARTRLPALRAHAQRVWRSPHTRRWADGLLLAVLVYGLLGFYAIPPLIRYYGQRVLSQALSRTVTIGQVRLNPYTLRLQVDDVHVAGRGAGASELASLDELVVQLSWHSLWHLKPIVHEVRIDDPQLHLVRTAPRHFNISDLMERYSRRQPAQSTGAPLRFAVFNIELSGGVIDFDDQVLQQQHHIRELQIGLPFIANLPSKTEVFVQPLLQAQVDGSPLRIAGRSKPFSSTRASDLTLRLHRLDLPRLLAYLPVKLPVTLVAGQLSSDLQLDFDMAGERPRLHVAGTLTLDGPQLDDAGGQPLFMAQSIAANASDIEPLRQIYHLASLKLQAPQLNATRRHDGQFDLIALASSNVSTAAPAPATASRPAGATTAAAPAHPATAVDFSLQQLTLSDGTLRLQDHAADTHYSLQTLNVSASGLATAAAAPDARYHLDATLRQGGTLNVAGTLNLGQRRATADVALKQLALAAFQPYLTTLTPARIDAGDASITAAVQADWSSSAAKLTLDGSRLQLDGLHVRGPAAPQLLTLRQAVVQLQSLDLAKRQALLQDITVDGLQLQARRAADGRINLAQLLRNTPASARRPAKAARPAAPWHYQVDRIAVSDSSVEFADHATPRPVTLKLSALQATLKDFSDDQHRAWPLTLRGTLQRDGRIAFGGTVRLAPLQLAGHVQLLRLDVAAVEPYFGSRLNAVVASALAYASGQTRLSRDAAGWSATFDGGAGLGAVRMLDKATSDPFAGWQQLRLKGIKAHYDAAGSAVSIDKVALNSFYARVFLDSSGKLNLSRFLAGQNSAPTSLTRADSAAPAAAASAPAATTSANPPLQLRIGEIDLADGSVDYSDHYIRPNFSAKLQTINGHVGTIGTQVTTPAAVALAATLDRGGDVNISGNVAPLAATPALDITAHARDIELTQFTSYSQKYTGYPISKGKLQVDLHYQLAQGELSADNHLFINQFTFGDHVDSPSATNLPVRLAVSLLKNASGDIDVNVPVSGSLSDPQFSLGSVIWTAFTNLIEKAVTAPFSLLTSAFGGGGKHLSYVTFAPGSATLDDATLAKLTTLAKALNDRPAVSIDLTGHVDALLDTPALKRYLLRQQVKQQKIKATGGDPATVHLSAAEYDKYLTAAYKAADFKRPRNFIGLLRTLPPARMQQLLLDHTVVDDAALLDLARRRAAAVRDWLAARVPPKRLFVVAPKLGQAQDVANTRVSFGLHR